ncbi:IMV membrane protein [Equine molluscum contagiosum-like virus]|nr:IMV membrane protein [Equine molluscum contagiosum-like virus]
MADRTTLSVHGLELNYVREHERASVRYAGVSTVAFFLLVLVASTVLFLYQLSDDNVFATLARYARIKSALRSWRPLVAAKTRLERERGRQLAARRADIFDFRCMDFGAFFLPVRLDRETFLPQAVRRGRGDGWTVAKAAPLDPGAQQFCEFVLRNHEDSTLTCGTEMFNEIGYSGYFEPGHWCRDFVDLLQ